VDEPFRPPVPGPPLLPSEAIEDAVARLGDLEHLPVADHVARFDAAHAALTAALAAIDRV
jgi:hypothetical protein